MGSKLSLSFLSTALSTEGFRAWHSRSTALVGDDTPICSPLSSDFFPVDEARSVMRGLWAENQFHLRSADHTAEGNDLCIYEKSDGVLSLVACNDSRVIVWMVVSADGKAGMQFVDSKTGKVLTLPPEAVDLTYMQLQSSDSQGTQFWCPTTGEDHTRKSDTPSDKSYTKIFPAAPVGDRLYVNNFYSHTDDASHVVGFMDDNTGAMYWKPVACENQHKHDIGYGLPDGITVNRRGKIRTGKRSGEAHDGDFQCLANVSDVVALASCDDAAAIRFTIVQPGHDKQVQVGCNASQTAKRVYWLYSEEDKKYLTMEGGSDESASYLSMEEKQPDAAVSYQEFRFDSIIASDAYTVGTPWALLYADPKNDGPPHAHTVRWGWIWDFDVNSASEAGFPHNLATWQFVDE